jgi:dolichyl-phosphate beta-glucosyltransferase
MYAPFISLIIPCFNETNRIGLMMDGLAEFTQAWKGPFEIILVDDGSTDGTSILIEKHPIAQSLKSNLNVISQSNTGKGGALKKGIEVAKGDYVLTLDADMATRPIELLKWIQLRNQFYEKEILIGSRELKTSIVHDLGYRKIVGNIFNWIIRSLVGLNIQDTQCGFKLYPRPIAQQLFASLHTMGWAHDVEILKKANQLGCAIVEMPITWNAIEGSKINVVNDSWKMFWEVMKIQGMKSI